MLTQIMLNRVSIKTTLIMSNIVNIVNTVNMKGMAAIATWVTNLCSATVFGSICF